MSMGFCANYVDVIEEKDIIKICGKTAKNFFNFFKNLEDGDELLEFFAIENDFDCDIHLSEEQITDIMVKYALLCDDFKHKTGLTLGISKHDSANDGDIYDEVDGVFWYVDGLYELSEAGKKLLDSGVKIKGANWVFYC